MKIDSSQKPDKAEVVIFPPLLFAITLIVGMAISYLKPVTILTDLLAWICGSILFIMSIVLLRLSARSLLQGKTTINPNGSTTSIIIKGVYRYSRNPMYISFLLLYLGISIIFNAWFCFVLLLPLLVVLQKGVVEPEEEYLERKFSAEYSSYKSKVRRWI